jgi:MGT family glycosyltransferase
MKGPDVPPAYSGYSTDDRSGWGEFRAEYDRAHRALWEEFNEWVVEQGAPPLPDLEFIHESDALNLYVYPEAIDYIDRRPLGPTWHRLDSSVRATDEPFVVPAPLKGGDTALVYFSLGSLGSADVELMRRVVASLAETPYEFIVSKGPLHAEIDLAENMWGAELVPQVSVLRLADVVITHGGNNTTTEAMHFGKPMVILPLFWDQHDNAQRVQEMGFGIRLDTYRFNDLQIQVALDRLLDDQELRSRMSRNSLKTRARKGTLRAADLIEGVAREAGA